MVLPPSPIPEDGGGGRRSKEEYELMRNPENESSVEDQLRFDEKTREACWRKAALLLGRDPERWRLDAAGNAVTRGLWGCAGGFGYMFDHIVPVSRGGESTVENCQVLQSKVYLSKPDEGWKDPAAEMRDNSPKFRSDFLTENLLDRAEVWIYGDVTRPGKQCRVWTVGEKLGLVKPMDNRPECEPYKASKHV